MIMGSTGAQIIMIAATPFLARLYEPQDFGVLATFLAIASIAGMFSTLRVERKVFSEVDDKNAELFFNTAIFVAFFVAVISSLVVLVLVNLNLIQIESFFALFIFVFSFFYAVNQTACVFASRINRFRWLVDSAFFRAATVIVLQVVLISIFPSQYSIVIGATFGLLVSSALIAVRVSKQVQKKDVLSSFRSVFSVKNNKKDAIYGGGQALLSSLSNNSPTVIISTLGGLSQAGFFLMAERLVRLPINLISNNLRNVIAAKISQDRKHVHKFLVRLSVGLFFIGNLIAIVFFYSSDWLFITFLGESWLQSSQISKIMFIWVIVNFATLPFQTFNLNFGLMKTVAQLELGFSLIKILSLIVIYKAGYGLLGAAFVISGVSSAQCLVHIYIYKMTFDKGVGRSYLQGN